MDLSHKFGLSGGDSKGAASAAKAIKEECSRYFTRMNQLDIRVNDALTEIKGLSQQFANKQDKLGSDVIKV
jgi:uncharacterized Ntn-hydrolase superfamily protein